ncbi:MAG: lamin tail domain-containing protein [Candidatus Edwardsbacteria bacterium]|nr:lamin tail domain-containing protein [Candidatus Edwardsbacteria bacterium]
MKKTLLALVLLLAAVSVNAQVVINEVQYDPIGGGTDTKTEWIELYNPTGDDIDLSGWIMCDNTDSIGETFPSTVLAAGEYLVLAALVDSFHLNYPAVPAIQWPDSSFGAGLANGADMLIILNAADSVIDQMNWGTPTLTWASWIRFGGWNPGCIDAAAGHSIGRSPNGVDTDLAVDWADMVVPTPGATNGGAVVYTPHTIYDIQNGGALTDSAVSVVGIVTSKNYVDFDGFMLAEASGPWHGIVVYSNANVVVGDSVIITGTVTEYNGLTELSASQVTVRGTGTVPAITNVSLADVKTGSPTAESYEGTLVRVPKALACDTTWMSPTYGEWAVCIGPDTLRIDNSSTTNGIYYAKPNFGVDSVTVTGVMTYSFSHFKLLPRDSADVINHGPTGVAGQPPIAKPVFSLMPCSPNPAGREARFSFSLANQGRVDLSVFNVLGQKVATVYSGQLSPGLHSLAWNLKGQNGQQLPNGVYFYNLSDGSRSSTRRMLILK